MQNASEINWHVPQLNLSVRDLFFGPEAKKYWMLAVLGLLAEAVVIYIVLNIPGDGRELLAIFALPVISIGYLKYYVGEKKRQFFFKSFSELNGFVYQTKSFTGIPDSSLFTVGHSKTKSHEISGTIGAVKFNIFSYQYTVGSGKTAHTYTSSVMELRLTSQVASMLLIPNTMSFGDELADNKLKNVSLVPLPAEFSPTYRLFCETKMEPEALHIFAPEILMLLKNQFANVTLEFMQNQVYVYSRSVADTPETLKPFFAFLDFTQRILLPRLIAQEGSVKAMQEVLTKAPAQGLVSKQWTVLKPEFKQGFLFFLLIIVFLIIAVLAINQLMV